MTSYEKRIQISFRSKSKKETKDFGCRCYDLRDLLKKKYPKANVGIWERFELEWKE